MRPLLLLFRGDIHRLEYDPATQYRFHFVSAWFWFGCMLAISLVPQFRHELLGLLIMEASLWANFATHLVPWTQRWQLSRRVKILCDVNHKQPPDLATSKISTQHPKTSQQRATKRRCLISMAS